MIRQFTIRGGYDNYLACADALTALAGKNLLYIACGHEEVCPVATERAEMGDCDCPELEIAVDVPDGTLVVMPRRPGATAHDTPEEALNPYAGNN